MSAPVGLAGELPLTHLISSVELSLNQAIGKELSADTSGAPQTPWFMTAQSREAAVPEPAWRRQATTKSSVPGVAPATV